MSNLDLAKESDREDKALDAIKYYEAAIAADEPGVDVNTYINLAMVCFCCSDFGYAATMKIPEEFIWSVAYPKASDILASAERRFGSLPEVAFWRKFLAWAMLGEEFPVRVALELANEGTEIPLFYVFSATAHDPAYSKAVKRIYESVKRRDTAKARYIESCLRRGVV